MKELLQYLKTNFPLSETVFKEVDKLVWALNDNKVWERVGEGQVEPRVSLDTVFERQVPPRVRFMSLCESSSPAELPDDRQRHMSDNIGERPRRGQRRVSENAGERPKGGHDDVEAEE